MGYTPRKTVYRLDLRARVCPVIGHEFRHNIVKVAVDPRGDSREDPYFRYFHIGVPPDDPEEPKVPDVMVWACLTG